MTGLWSMHRKKKDYCNVTTSLAYPLCDNKFRLPKEASKSTEVFNNMNCVSKKQCVTTSTVLDRWRSFKRSKGYVFDLLTLRRRHFCVSKICSKRVDIVPISLSTFWIFWSFFGGLIEWKLSLLCLDARLESYKRLSPFNSPVYISIHGLNCYAPPIADTARKEKKSPNILDIDYSQKNYYTMIPSLEKGK